MDPADNYDLEKITKVLDKELIRKGKDYLKISEANDILLNEKIFNQNDCRLKVLKKLLENGKLPHAYLANTLPPVWRIPHSIAEKEEYPPTDSKLDKDSIATVTKSNKRYVSCPYCYKSSIYVRVADRENPILSCPACNAVFTNPLLNSKPSHNPKTIKKGTWILGLIILLTLYLIFNNNSISDCKSRQC